MLDLDFNSEQEMLRSTVREVLATMCPTSVVRAMEDDLTGYPADLWHKLSELDLVGLLLPERWGGSGMSLIEGVALYEEFGRALAPIPHFASSVLCGGVLAAGGTRVQQERWLPSIASGTVVMTPAWLEPESGFGTLGVRTSAVADGTDFVLTGRKRYVPFARAADRLVVVARMGDGAGDIDLFIVDPNAPGVTFTQQFSIASDTQFDVELDGVRVAADDRIGSPGSGWKTWQQVLNDGLVLLAAQAMGGARKALDLTVQYSKDRYQFDKPLGAFQSIAHYLADAVTRVDGGEQLVHEAAWTGASGHALDRLAPSAKLFACRTFRDVTAMAQQVFGGIGFSLEFDIQLYFRRAKAQQLSWSDDRDLEQRVAAAVLD